ncbi:hypothetical protein SUGI_1227300 [Cryptomeria japonica]|uniref:Reverse transcriptase domain-containing protein n=1 Tax=Cryptomeria japonica TaxID=3369 RepID=A0AAD3RMH1_CRYJA|nr:hypothetical protein SUGI_1227300 [Cryptomeria japonica]
MAPMIPLLVETLLDLRRKKASQYEAISEVDFAIMVARLQKGEFRFHAMRRLLIPKPKKPGRFRPITIPDSKDVLVMDAAAELLNEIFRSIFLDCSHGFIKGRGTWTFFASVESWGLVNHFVQADIVSCFDMIPHDKLFTLLSQHISERAFIGLIHNFLTTDIFDKEGQNCGNRVSGIGIPQGSSLSPVLMNIFLHKFDQAISEWVSTTYPLIRYARYADDFFIGIKESSHALDPEPIVSMVRKLMKDELSLDLSIRVAQRGDRPLSLLGFRVSLDERGQIHLNAPLKRIRTKLESKLTPPQRTETTGEVVAYYNQKVIAYLAAYCIAENGGRFKGLLERCVRRCCFKQLGNISKTYLSALKQKYGHQLQRTTPPFFAKRLTASLQGTSIDINIGRNFS